MARHNVRSSDPRKPAIVAALKMREPLPSDTPAIGDVLTVAGVRFQLVAVTTASGRTSDRFASYRFRAPDGSTLDVVPEAKKMRASRPWKG
jgi:hypothetical protein